MMKLKRPPRQPANSELGRMGGQRYPETHQAPSQVWTGSGRGTGGPYLLAEARHTKPMAVAKAVGPSP